LCSPQTLQLTSPNEICQLPITPCSDTQEKWCDIGAPSLAWSTEQPIIILLAAAAGKIWYCLPDRIVMGDICFRLNLNQSWEAIDIQTGAGMVIPKGSYKAFRRVLPSLVVGDITISNLATKRYSGI
jgi:hypothetical protein